jgi:hypothetical protein
MLRRIFGHMRHEVTRYCRKLHNKELHSLFFLPVVIRMIRSRKARWAGHRACMREIRSDFNILVGKHEGRRHSEDLGVDGRIIDLS